MSEKTSQVYSIHSWLSICQHSGY